MQSGAIGNSQTSWIETTVTGDGTLSFWWKVSSEDGYDWLICTTNGVEVMQITGEAGWESQALNIAGGETTIRWTFEKDRVDIDPVGMDCGWLDGVEWVPAVAQDPMMNYGAWLTLQGLDGTPENKAQWLIDPNDPNAIFSVKLEMRQDESSGQFHIMSSDPPAVVPHVEWAPDLGDLRSYVVMTKTNLLEGSWDDVAPDDVSALPSTPARFFRVRVEEK